MSIFEQLSKNKGTVSTTLSKKLAQKVLQEKRLDILLECIDLVVYQASAAGARHIRAGAAKVVELTAEKQPELAAPYLEKLLPALSVSEPQTRWMVMRIMGYCAHLNKSAAQKAVSYAEKFINNKEGLVLASSADLFLGDLGAVSEKDAQKVFPLLEQSMQKPLPNEQDWLLEAFLKIFKNIEPTEKEKALKFANHWQKSARKSTQQRAGKLLKLQ